MVARINLCVDLSAFYFDARGSLTIPRRLQFANKASLLKLGKYRRDLSHGHLERVVRLREIVARGCQHANTTLNQGNDASLLHNQLSSYRQILVTAGPVRRRRFWVDGQQAWQ